MQKQKNLTNSPDLRAIPSTKNPGRASSPRPVLPTTRLSDYPRSFFERTRPTCELYLFTPRSFFERNYHGHGKYPLPTGFTCPGAHTLKPVPEPDSTN